MIACQVKVGLLIANIVDNLIWLSSDRKGNDFLVIGHCMESNE